MHVSKRKIGILVLVCSFFFVSSGKLNLEIKLFGQQCQHLNPVLNIYLEILIYTKEFFEKNLKNFSFSKFFSLESNIGSQE